MKIILLGNHLINTSREDVYHYIFNRGATDRSDVILECDYLNDLEMKTADDHLAEFSAYYVFYKYNPLEFNDEDTFCMLSSRKFEEYSNLKIDDVLVNQITIDKILKEYGGIYAFLHHAGDVYKTAMDYTPFLKNPNNGLFNYDNTSEILSDLRSVYNNYPSHPGRHYFCFTYKTFKEFYHWIHVNLFVRFFNDDFSEKTNDKGESLIRNTHPNNMVFTKHRAFGLIVEHFHHKFFYDTNTQQYWHPYSDKKPTKIYEIRHINSNLDWVVKEIQLWK